MHYWFLKKTIIIIIIIIIIIKTSRMQFYKSFAEKSYTEPTTIKRGGTIALKLLTVLDALPAKWL